MEELITRLNYLEKLILNTKKEIHQKYCDSSEDIETKFFKWARSGCQTFESPWLIHVLSTSGKDLINDWYGDDEPDRHEVFDLDRITESICVMLNTDYEYCQENLNNRNITRQDIRDWMTELLKMNFKSFTWGW